MKYCNPIEDFSAYLCDIPAEWRNAFAEALNCALNSIMSANLEVENNGNCEGIQDCQTNTQFNITLVNNILTATFVNEKNITTIVNTDLTDAINEALDAVDPKCLMTQEEWDALTYQERLNAIFDKVCCVHGDCGSGSGCGCEDCGDGEECIGLEACPCVTYEVIGEAPYSFTYKDCDTKEITQFDSAEDDVIHICAIRGTVITPLNVICNEIDDECSDIPITTTTTSTSTTSTSSTTTTTTDAFDYYLADEYACPDCGTIVEEDVVVKFPTGTGVVIGDFYYPVPIDGNVYQLISLTTPAVAIDLTISFHSGVCATSCADVITTTTTTSTTTTSSTTTTTTILPPPTTTTTTSTSSTTTTSSSTTTTTTEVETLAYYLADEYFCEGCVFMQGSLLVSLPISHVVQVGKFYMPVIFGGLLYNIISPDAQPAGPAIALTEGNWSTCFGACQ